MKNRRAILIAAIMLQSSVALSAEGGIVSESNSESNAEAAVTANTQSFTFAPISKSIGSRTPATGGFAISGFPQLFNDPGVGANAVADPLIWYYLDALASPCVSDPELKVEQFNFVTVSYQPDCGLNLGVKDSGPLGKITPIVHYVSDVDENTSYIPLGTISVQANWDQSESVNLLTLIKTAENFLRKNITGFDHIILSGDILKRSVSHQRSVDADGDSVAVTPSISSALGRDGLTGSLFGWGSSTGTTRPHSRKGATFFAAAIMPGPWAGHLPRISQKAYFSNTIALPKELRDNKQGTDLKGHPTTQVRPDSQELIELKSQLNGLGNPHTITNP